MTTEMNTILQLKRGTTEEWNAKSTYVPKEGEPCLNLTTGKIKYGDGVSTYAELDYSGGSSSHYEGTKQTGESDTDVITRVLNGLSKTPNEGDIFVVKTLVSEGHYSYTAYVYDGENWAAMDGCYNAKNIYFDQNLMFTYAFGKYTPDASGSVTIPAKDESLSLYDIFMKSYSQETNPTVSNPSISFTVGNQSGEVGSTYNLPIATFKVDSVGNYTYGSEDASGNKFGASDTGVLFKTGDVTITQGSNTKSNTVDLAKNNTMTLAATSSGSTLFSDEKTVYDFSVSAAYTESDRVPVTNLGTKKSELKITNGTLTKTCKATMTGWRKMFMGTLTDASTELTSDVIRGLTLVNKQVQTSAQTFTVPVGAAKIVVAAPAGYTISKVEYFTMSWEEFAGFEAADSVDVADARGGTNGLKAYNVYTYTPASAFEAATQFRITLKA